MTLQNIYVQATNRISDLFGKIRDGQAPSRFTQQLLKDWGFNSTNDRAFIPLLKALGFLTSEGTPTQRYLDYRDHSRSKAVMARALRETYSDIFLIKEHPTSADRVAIEGKFKSFHNVSDNVGSLMSKTFFALLMLADLNTDSTAVTPPQESAKQTSDALPASQEEATPRPRRPSLHYNIEIHLPATKDIEVYNAIFKSLREHVFNE
jgi:hypothetical protein